MTTLIAIILVFIALFVNPAFSFVIIAGVIIYNAMVVYDGIKYRDVDPFEFYKSIIVNGGIMIICLGIVIWSLI